MRDDIMFDESDHKKAQKNTLDILEEAGYEIRNKEDVYKYQCISAPQEINRIVRLLIQDTDPVKKTALQKLLSNSRIAAELLKGLWLPLVGLSALGMILSTFLIFHDKPYLAILFAGITNLIMFLVIMAVVFSKLNKLKG